MKLYKNSYLILAIMIPVIMILIICLSNFYYQVEIIPNNNFLYLVSKKSEQYSCAYQVSFELFPNQKKPQFKPTNQIDCSSVDLYIYNFKNNSKKKITMVQAKYMAAAHQLQQDSPEGYHILEFCRYTDAGLGLRGGNHSVCVEKNNQQRKLDIRQSVSPAGGYEKVNFIGWIVGQNQNQKGTTHE